MRIRNGFVLREVHEQYIVCPSFGKKSSYFGIITLNNCGKILFENLLNEVTKEELITLLEEKFGDNEEDALKDLDSFLALLDDKNVIEYS